jgi:hypothetical protein
MLDILELIFKNKDINLNDLGHKIITYNTPIIGNKKISIKETDWHYSINRLPQTIFKEINTIKYILHLPGDYYIQNKLNKINKTNKTNKISIELNKNLLKNSHFTFRGKRVYVDEYTESCFIESSNNKTCIMHINLRDTFTDVSHFISNLLVHKLFIDTLNLSSTKRLQYIKTKKIDSMYNTNDYKKIKGIQVLTKKQCTLLNPCKPLIIRKASNKLIKKNNIINYYKNINSLNQIGVNNYLLKSKIPNYIVEWNNRNFKKSLDYLNDFYIEEFTKLKKIIEEKLLYNEKTQELRTDKNKELDYSIHFLQAPIIIFLIMTYNMNIDVNSISENKFKYDFNSKYKDLDLYYLKLLGLFHKNKKDMFNKFGKIHYIKSYKNLNKGVIFNVLDTSQMITSSDKLDPVLKSLKFLNYDKNRKLKKKIFIVNINIVSGSRGYNVGYGANKVFGNKIKTFNIIAKAGSISKDIKINDTAIINDIKLLDKSIYEKLLNMKFKDTLKLCKYSNNNKIKQKITKTNKIKYNLNYNVSLENSKIHITNEACVPSVILQDMEKFKKINKTFKIIEMESFWYKLALQNTCCNVMYYISDNPFYEEGSLSNIQKEEKESVKPMLLYFGLYRILFDWIKKYELQNN